MPPDEMHTEKGHEARIDPAKLRRAPGARKLCGAAHAPFCAICGLSLPWALDVAHLDQQPGNNAPDNLAFLCKTHHKLFDIGFYPLEMVTFLRDRWTAYRDGAWKPDHKLSLKDAGAKAAETRKWREAGRKAHETRRKKKAAALLAAGVAEP